jgi:hypothetical protein
MKSCPDALNSEQIKKMCYIHTMEYYTVRKKNKILSFTATQIELEDIM